MTLPRLLAQVLHPPTPRDYSSNFCARETLPINRTLLRHPRSTGICDCLVRRAPLLSRLSGAHRASVLIPYPRFQRDRRIATILPPWYRFDCRSHPRSEGVKWLQRGAPVTLVLLTSGQQPKYGREWREPSRRGSTESRGSHPPPLALVQVAQRWLKSFESCKTCSGQQNLWLLSTTSWFGRVDKTLDFESETRNQSRPRTLLRAFVLPQGLLYHPFSVG